MKIDTPKSQAELDNYANQLNPDHIEFDHSREEPDSLISEDDDELDYFDADADHWADDCYLTDFE